MLISTALLMLLALKQEQQFWPGRLSDTPWAFQPPARLAAELLNGPGFYLTFPLPGIKLFGQHLYDFGRLPGVALFWTWIGWKLDGRLSGNRRHVIKIAWLRFCVHATLFASSLLLMWATVSDLHSSGLLLSRLCWEELSVWGLWLSFLMKYAAIPWFLAGVIHFWKQLLDNACGREPPRIAARS